MGFLKRAVAEVERVELAAGFLADTAAFAADLDEAGDLLPGGGKLVGEPLGLGLTGYEDAPAAGGEVLLDPGRGRGEIGADGRLKVLGDDGEPAVLLAAVVEVRAVRGGGDQKRATLAAAQDRAERLPLVGAAEADVAVRFEDRLHSLERLYRDDRFVLALVHVIAVLDLADVDALTQEVGKRVRLEAERSGGAVDGRALGDEFKAASQAKGVFVGDQDAARLRAGGRVGLRVVAGGLDPVRPVALTGGLVLAGATAVRLVGAFLAGEEGLDGAEDFAAEVVADRAVLDGVDGAVEAPTEVGEERPLKLAGTREAILSIRKDNSDLAVFDRGAEVAAGGPLEDRGLEG